MKALNLPLMENNISREAFEEVIKLLKSDDPILTQSNHVKRLEEEWSEWIGTK